MGQGADETNQTETIQKQNSRLASSVSDEKSNGLDEEKARGSAFTKRTRSSTLAGGEGEGRQGGRNRSGTLAGGEAHDHDEAFPREEQEQMEELLHELTGQLGEDSSIAPNFLSEHRLTCDSLRLLQSSSRLGA